jgi:putative FmdB family regulatory protein
MAIYEYKCQRCGSFELVKSMRDACSRDKCPTCGNEAPRVYSCNWKPFEGSYEYDRRNGFFPGCSSADLAANKGKENW